MVARGLAALAMAAIGLLLAAFSSPPFLGAAIALLAGGAAAFVIAGAFASPQPYSETPAATPAGPSLPAQSDLLNAVEEPLLIVRDRRVLLANEAARRMLGQHIEGVDVRLAIRHPAAAERLTHNDEDAGRIELVGIGEQERRWEMSITPLADGSRLVRLTDRSEAVASEKMRGDFVANASHELRTPLATLLGFLETLEDEEAAADPKTRGRFLGIMQDEARRMQRLVDDLISLSRIEAERFSAPREAVPLLSLVEEVEASCGRIIEEKGSAVSVEDRAGGPVVLGDRAQLLQLLQNLVVNALKYGRNGTPVTIRFEESGKDMLLIRLIDQGEGIAPEHLPRLTERFYRVDAGRSRSVGGTGLGLAIVKHIAQRHRGRLEIRSTPGVGTEVRVWLPRALDRDVIKES